MAGKRPRELGKKLAFQALFFGRDQGRVRWPGSRAPPTETRRKGGRLPGRLPAPEKQVPRHIDAALRIGIHLSDLHVARLLSWFAAVMKKLHLPFAFGFAFLAAGLAPLQAAAAPREIEITANDQMKYSLATIEAKAGETLKVTLKNVGTLPKEAMGHNWVLLKPGTDINAFAMAAMTAKDQEYIPPAQKDKVVASIKVLGPKQTADVTFTVSAPGEYVYLCSFPGHYMLMKGTLTVK